MISHLQGRIIIKEERFIVVSAGGVGYKVFLASSKIEKLKKNKEVSLFCSLRLKKDSWDLYGFLSYQELELFDFLMGISSVGPKAALEISSLGSLEKLKKAVKEDNQEIIDKLFKAGRKKAQAVIFEISREIKDRKDKDEDEIIRPLVKLGFSKKEIKDVLPGITKEAKAETRIKEALKALGR
jgi:holliday junction DNA helicase RuvA